MVSVVIGSSTEFVSITVLARRHPEAKDYWDGNWVGAQVEVQIPPWSGRYGADLRTEEFARFREALEVMNRDLRGSATFDPMEPWIGITLEVNPLGHVRMSGKAAPEDHGRIFGQVGLTWDLEDVLDQSFLPALITQLRQAEEAFPVIGRPTD